MKKPRYQMVSLKFDFNISLSESKISPCHADAIIKNSMDILARKFVHNQGLKLQKFSRSVFVVKHLNSMKISNLLGLLGHIRLML